MTQEHENSDSEEAKKPSPPSATESSSTSYPSGEGLCLRGVLPPEEEARIDREQRAAAYRSTPAPEPGPPDSPSPSPKS